MALITSGVARGLVVCPVCGAPKATCTDGHPSDVVPVDDPANLTVKEKAMTEPEELGVYTYTSNGNEVTGQLSRADAEKFGARPVDASGDDHDDTDDGDADQRPVTKARKSAKNK